ncbi:DUF826 domain-containing protein [Candidatus Symbiopectobacterium sp.]|nr:DUF826 domain-containing protein [Candidatus Symbiopectobacterium sp.]
MRGSVVSLGCQHKIYLLNKALDSQIDGAVDTALTDLLGSIEQQ